jgi:hypothetical protein
MEMPLAESVPQAVKRKIKGRMYLYIFTFFGLVTKVRRLGKGWVILG